MKRILTLTVYITLFILTGLTGYAQSKPAAKSKKPTTTKKTTQPAATDTTGDMRIGASPDDASKVDTSAGMQAALPPLPDIDTVAAPNDELTAKIKKLLKASHGMDAGVNTMKAMIESQRKNPSSQLPDEFFARFIGAIDNGRVVNLMEIVVIKIYRQKFTLQEMKDINKFYETPVGQKLAAETVNISEAARSGGEKIGQYIALQIIGDLMKEGKWK